ncbi:MAG TPA: tetratricopeptide repeat protein [Ignavibacteria bacterium]|nr:tetratricopeptide repeat protein [Ignavibacteria bacterium]
MNRLTKYALGIIILLFVFTNNNFASDLKIKYNFNTPADSVNLLEQYSLFSEYYKNKDFESALPYGWKVLSINPKKFGKWIFYKMEDILWQLHDSSTVSPKEKKAINDTIMYVYDLALKYDTSSANFFLPRRAFVAETWLKLPPAKVIAYYLEAIKANPNISTYWINRLGLVYKNNASDKNDYKEKAIELYSKLSEKEPNNPEWNAQLESMVENIDQLVQLTKKAWDQDKNNLAKAWKYVSIAQRAGEYDKAIVGLEFLASKAPKTINYWTQLATAYLKVGNLKKAEEAYKTLIKLEPGKKENHLNLGIIYKDGGKFAKARTEYIKAYELDKSWGLPIFYEGLLYELSARKRKFDFQDKLVYLLAVQTYRKALRIDPTLDQAKARLKALSSSLPTKEDYFFRGYKKGTTLKIKGKYFEWIKRSVTVR